jgi:hypothetical protein
MSRLICCMALWLGCLLPFAAAAGKNIAPTVSLTAPANGANFTAPAILTLAATATDSDGAIAKVEFYRGGATLIGTATTPPYSVTWSNVPAGSYSLTAKATDNRGKATTSTAVSVTVNAAPPNTPPTVSLTAPANGASFTEPATVTLAASAADADGGVAKVEFYQGATLIGTATSAPYAYAWSNVPAGSYTLTARATDNLGASTTSGPVNIAVGKTNLPPLVVLTAPAYCGAFDTASGIDLNADAVDPDGSVVRVDYYAGDTLVGSAANPSSYSAGTVYPFHWTGMAAGTYTLRARATDSRGAVAVSDPITLTLAPPNQPPSVYLTAPASGAVFGSTAPIIVAVEASDSDGGVAKVEFHADYALIGTATAPPYTVVWNGAKSAGQYALTAQVTDNRGAVTVSQDVLITISANAPPTVSLTAPATGASFTAPATVNLAASAADTDGSIARVDFYRGTTLIGTATSAPYVYTWSGVPAGSYTLTAKATDNLGTTTTSAPVSITVNAPPPNTPPTVSLTAPANGASFTAPATINLGASAADADGGIAKVEFFQGAALIGTVTSAPYAYVWTAVPAGSYTLTAKAADNLGATTASAPVSILVNAFGLTIVSPVDGATVAGDHVTVSGSFQAPPHSGISVNGVVAVVVDSDFYAHDVPISAGPQTLTATLTTLDGKTASQSISVTGAPAPGVQINASPQSGLPPLEVNFTITNTTPSPIQKVEIDWDGNGTFDLTMSGDFTLTYSTPWTYRTAVKVTLADGSAYTQSFPIVVQDAAQMDQMFKSLWSGMNDALIAGDKAAALNYLSPPARAKYGPVFDVLMPHMAEIVGSYSQPQLGNYSEGMAEYAIGRTINGTRHVFLIYFLQDPSGIWRLDSM